MSTYKYSMNEKNNPLPNRLTTKEMLEDIGIRLDMIEEHLVKKHKYSIDPGIATVLAAIIVAGATLLGFAIL